MDDGICLGCFELPGFIYFIDLDDSIPLLHVNSESEGYHDACFLLSEAKYYGKESLELGITESGLEEIDEYLREDCEEYPGLTNWEAFCKMWNDNKSEKNIVFPDKQPDYTKTIEIIE